MRGEFVKKRLFARTPPELPSLAPVVSAGTKVTARWQEQSTQYSSDEAGWHPEAVMTGAWLLLTTDSGSSGIRNRDSSWWVSEHWWLLPTLDLEAVTGPETHRPMLLPYDMTPGVERPARYSSSQRPTRRVSAQQLDGGDTAFFRNGRSLERALHGVVQAVGTRLR